MGGNLALATRVAGLLQPSVLREHHGFREHQHADKYIAPCQQAPSGQGRFLWPIAKAEARRADVRPREGPIKRYSRCIVQVLCTATHALLASPHSPSSRCRCVPSAGVSVHRLTRALSTRAVSAHSEVPSVPSATDEPSTCHSSGSDLPFDFLPHKATAPTELKFRN